MTRSGLVTAIAAAWLVVATPNAADGLIIPNGYPVPESQCLFPTEHVQQTGTVTIIPQGKPPEKPRTVIYDTESTCFVQKRTYSIVVEPGDTLTKIADVLDRYVRFTTPENLARQNKIANPDHIEPGMTVRVSETYRVLSR